MKNTFTVLTLDEAHASLRKDLGSAPPKPPGGPSQRKRRMSTGGQTVQLKPVGTTPKGKPFRAIPNDEAIANLRAGKFHEKSLSITLDQLARALNKAMKPPTKTSATQASSWARTATRMSKDTNLTSAQSHFHHNVAAHAHTRAAQLHAKLGNAAKVTQHKAAAKMHTKAAAASPDKSPIETSHYKR